MKQVKSVLSAILISGMLTGAALAAEIGVVDMQMVTQKYTKAQTYATEAKTREDELQKFREGLLSQLKAGDKLSPVEKKTLEEKLNGQFATKFKEYRDWAMTQEQGLRTSVETAIQTVSQAQKLDVVFPKQAVLNGGHDITPDVINSLNK